jgi:hypothetical protein
LIQELRHAFTGNADGPNPMVVLPIDDADLIPDLLPRLFSDIRRLAHPRVVPLVCLTESSVRDALANHNLRHWRSMDFGPAQSLVASPENVSLAVQRQLVKALPVHLRVILEDVHIGDRLTFIPIRTEGSESLGDLLARFPIAGMAHIDSLADLFTIREASSNGIVAPSAHCECLPSSPRELEQLHARLSLLAMVDEGLPGEIQTRQAIQHIVSSAIERSSMLLRPSFQRPITWQLYASRWAVRFDIGGYDHGHNVGIGLVVRRHRTRDAVIDNTVHVRRFAGYYMTEAAPRDTDVPDGVSLIEHRRQRPGNAIEFPHTYSQALYLANDVAQEREPFLFAGTVGGLSAVTHMGWRFMSASYQGQGAHDSLWLIPAWDSFYDVLLMGYGWNRVFDLIEQVEVATPQHDRLLEWFLLRHLELVVTIQDSRRLPPLDWSNASVMELLQNDNAMRAHIAEIISDLEIRMMDLYARSMASRARQRDYDFKAWVDIFMCFSTDTIACSGRLSRAILRTRDRIITSHGTRSRANSQAAYEISRLIRGNLHAPWWDTLIAVLERLDSGTALEVRTAYDRARALRSARYTSVLDQLAAGGLSRDLLLRLRAFGVTDETANELRSAGVPDEIVASLRELASAPPMSVAGAELTRHTALMTSLPDTDAKR